MLDQVNLKTEAESVIVQETGAGRFQVMANTGASQFLIDEPLALGGLGSGPNPYDLIGAALAACTAMTLRLYADRKEWQLQHVAVRVVHTRGSLNASDRFDCELMLEGQLDIKQRKHLLEIANRCPVHITLARGSGVTTYLGGLVSAEKNQLDHSLHGLHMIESCIDPHNL